MTTVRCEKRNIVDEFDDYREAKRKRIVRVAHNIAQFPSLTSPKSSKSSKSSKTEFKCVVKRRIKIGPTSPSWSFSRRANNPKYFGADGKISLWQIVGMSDRRTGNVCVGVVVNRFVERGVASIAVRPFVKGAKGVYKVKSHDAEDVVIGMLRHCFPLHHMLLPGTRGKVNQRSFLVIGSPEQQLQQARHVFLKRNPAEFHTLEKAMCNSSYAYLSARLTEELCIEAPIAEPFKALVIDAAKVKSSKALFETGVFAFQDIVAVNDSPAIANKMKTNAPGLNVVCSTVCDAIAKLQAGGSNKGKFTSFFADYMSTFTDAPTRSTTPADDVDLILNSGLPTSKFIFAITVCKRGSANQAAIARLSIETSAMNAGMATRCLETVDYGTTMMFVIFEVRRIAVYGVHEPTAHTDL